jgi:hypothetical protein
MAGLLTSTEQKVPSALVVRPATDGAAGRPSEIGSAGGRLVLGSASLREVLSVIGHQPHGCEPLVVVCDGVGLGAGALGGGVTVVGFGVGLADVGPGVGWAPGELCDPEECLVPRVAEPCFFAPCLDDDLAEGLADGLPLGLVLGVVTG